MNREELKARLMSEAEKAIEQLLSEKAPAGSNTLTEIERLAVKSGETFKAEVLRALIAEDSQVRNEEDHLCPQCGQRMHHRGQHQRTVLTEAGESAVERTYYSCPGCGKAFFALDKAWELDASGYSPEVKRQMTWLSGLLPFAQAEAVLWRIGKRHISDSSLWRGVQAESDRLAPSRCAPLPDSAASALPPTTLLSMDGGMVNIRDEG